MNVAKNTAVTAARASVARAADFEIEPVALFLIGGTANSNAVRRVGSESLKQGGWARFCAEDVEDAISRGFKRIWLKLPGGSERFEDLPDDHPANQMHLTAMAKAREAKLYWLSNGFAKEMKALRERLEAMGGELGLYMGAAQYDPALIRLTPAMEAPTYQEQIAIERPVIDYAAAAIAGELLSCSVMGIDSLHNLPSRLKVDANDPSNRIPLRAWPVRLAEKISHTLKRGGKNKNGRVYVETYPNKVDESWFCDPTANHGIYVPNRNQTVWQKQWPGWALPQDAMPIGLAGRPVIVEMDAPPGELIKTGCHDGLRAFEGCTWANKGQWLREWCIWVQSRGWAPTVNPWDVKELGWSRADF